MGCKFTDISFIDSSAFSDCSSDRSGEFPTASSQSRDPQLQEYGDTAILNLSLCDENKEEIAYSGAIKPLVRALRSAAARENAACALLRLSLRWRRTRLIEVLDNEEGVSCLLWLTGSRYIATGCVDGKVRVWDSLSGDCAKIFSGHSDAVQSIAASANGDFLVSVSIDGTGRVFEIAEFR
ncbi:transcription initiation factor TFIID subunit 5 [Phtheirospermum japonicum]|uniref:Transcription initiation factor TFIID subunit 5 n=1 Tax=Phtheirospermum japonicum TaxID=374723 RepID=A0A830C833_9LAMI|nr:transcription initiation factor TFIID subunit 5 [Phtheirospermum japonicum]